MVKSPSNSAMKHNRSTLGAPTSNLTIRLKVSKGSHFKAEEGGQLSQNAAVSDKNEGRKGDLNKICDDGSVDSIQPSCQIEGCTDDLTSANSYLCRNQVCQNHFSAYKVVVGNLEQRFCQQCNRFHTLSKFEEDRRSCRFTLTRKRSQPEATSVLSSGTLIYLPGKSCNTLWRENAETTTNEETTERTVTNEETSGMENILKDDASSVNVQKERRPGSCDSRVLESSRYFVPEEPDNADSRNEVGMLYAVPVAKNDGGKRKGNLGSFSLCQVEGCMLDLSTTKEYFRRRKVCEGHFKASKVLVKNLEQRFCQQCSRFHVLAEFDEGRKSCKRMLMGHNMRRKAQMTNFSSPSSKV